AEETRRLAAGEPSVPLPERFLLFVGKLEENKGARLLVPAVAAARTGLPLVVLGEGSLAHALKFDAAEKGVPLLVRGWAEREDVLRVMARAAVLVFPSLWPEPLSRVLLEALALGTPVAAMDTGGTREILAGADSGLLVEDAAALSDAVARLAADEALRRRVSEGARHRAEASAPPARGPRHDAVCRTPRCVGPCGAGPPIPSRPRAGWRRPCTPSPGTCRRAASSPCCSRGRRRGPSRSRARSWPSRTEARAG